MYVFKSRTTSECYIKRITTILYVLLFIIFYFISLIILEYAGDSLGPKSMVLGFDPTNQTQLVVRCLDTAREILGVKIRDFFSIFRRLDFFIYFNNYDCI